LGSGRLVHWVLCWWFSPRFFWKRPDHAIRVATASIAEVICSGVFVEGMTPERAFTESYAYDKGLNPLKRGLHYAVNRANRRIKTDWRGHVVSLSTYYFAQKQQLEPLCMHHVSMEFDGAQTLIGSTRIYA
jgi:hypothetical protein